MNLAELTFTEEAGSLVVDIRGDIDRSNAVNLQDAITSRISNTRVGLVLDLTATTYLDSSGIRMLYQLQERLSTRGQSLALVIPTTSPAQHALRLAGISGHIQTVATRDELTPPPEQQAQAATPPAEQQSQAATPPAEHARK